MMLMVLMLLFVPSLALAGDAASVAISPVASSSPAAVAVPGKIDPAHKQEQAEALKGTASSEKLTPADAKLLLKEFQKAQALELKALEHRQKIELKELKSVHAARLREWEAREKQERREFFAAHTGGPEKRGYIKDRQERHKVFVQMLAEERVSRIRDHDVRIKAIKQDQEARRKEFKQALDQGERPLVRLWPNAN